MGYDIFNQQDNKAFVIDIFTKGLNFNVPSYQRGYRWGEKQVNELLNDLKEIVEKNAEYCLNTIALSKNNHQIDIIDGQQRLTALYILYYHLGIKVTTEIYYEVRNKNNNNKKDLCKILANLSNNVNGSNVDEIFFSKTIETIKKWFSKNQTIEKVFIKYLKNNKLHYLIYEVDKDDAYGVFIRMNKEKIPLTSGEKVKSLFISYDDIKNQNSNIKLDIAYSWDNIENELQNDDFWYFVYNEKPSKATDEYDINDCRIEFILNIILKKNEIKDSLFEAYYNRYKNYINNKNSVNEQDDELDRLWIEIEHCFGVLKDWYNDLEMYHYIGFILYNSKDSAEKIKDLYIDYVKKSKNEFVKHLKEETKRIIINSLRNLKGVEGVITNDEKTNEEIIDYDKLIKYEFDGDYSPKTKLYTLLMFSNIAYYINKSINVSKKDDYNGQKLEEKFSFYHFKKDDWQIEHISPANDKDIYSDKTLQLQIVLEILYYLQNISICDKKTPSEEMLFLKKIILSNDENNNKEMVNLIDNDEKNVESKLIDFYEKNKDEKNERKIKNNFKELNIETIIKKNFKIRIADNAKNALKNFCLLDAETNEGYGNSLFFEKRRWILGKSLGNRKKLVLNKEGKVVEESIMNENKPFSSYILPCTEKVFAKSFTNGISNLYSWSDSDGENYVNAIKEIVNQCLREMEIFKEV